jgi:hypothetical protein
MESIILKSHVAKSVGTVSVVKLLENTVSILTKSESVSSVLLKTVSTVSTIYIEES